MMIFGIYMLTQHLGFIHIARNQDKMADTYANFVINGVQIFYGIV